MGLSFRSYITGFVLSLILTICAFFSVTNHWWSGKALVTVIIGLAVTQVFVQLFFFLHLGHETKPRWKLGVFLLMILVLGIIVIGSLWIMQNLNYNMTPQDMTDYITKDEGIKQ